MRHAATPCSPPEASTSSRLPAGLDLPLRRASRGSGWARRMLLGLGALLILGGLAWTADTAEAGELSRTFPFELGTWYELDVTDGPVTLHRIRVRRREGPVTKARLFRGVDTPYAETVVIELEYTNDTEDQEWEADILAHWVDSEGRPIDGYDDTESLNEDEGREIATMTIATLKYGIQVAKEFVVAIDFYED